ncbi:MAG: hypothetical protein ABSF56_03150 [Minisyncoccia bacterium]|jgi:primosomal protein N' (replication factor Y)
MNLIAVIPLSRLKVAPTLSYFTSSEVPVGAVVTVPLRSRSVHAIVAEARRAEDLKAELRSAPYEIRKLGKVKAGAFFSTAFMDSCRTLADWYGTNTGAVVKAMVSETILENAHRIAPPLPLQPSFLGAEPAPDETYAVEGDDADRMSSWRSLIRQEFARKKSVAVYVPTIEDARRTFAALEKGIEGYIILLHGGLSKKKALEAWAAAAENRHPVVVVATASFSVLPRGDVETVVIERENSRGWVSQRAPCLDLRRALEAAARREHRTVFLSDCLLRVETLKRLDEHEIAPGTPFKWRSVSTAKDSLIDMRRVPKAGVPATAKGKPGSDEEKQPFRVISAELESLIAENRRDSTHLFILTARRGLSPITTCDDCGTVVLCSQCSAPVVLHASKETGAPGGRQGLPAGRHGKNFFMCHVCGERRSAEETCKNCGSWRLSPLGIGIDRAEQEIREGFPDIDMFKIDADATKTEGEMAEVMEKWKARPGSVLLGTEAALSRLAAPVDHAAVVSLDSLFALPDFRITERVMYLLVRLRAAVSRSILVQTRRPEEKIFEYGLKGNLSDFYHAVLSERRRFDYPPFSTLIKITLEGKKDRIAKEMGELQAFLAPHDVDVFPAFTSTVRGASVIHGLIRVPSKHWPEPELVAKLRSLPPGVSVKIDPESLL